MISLLAALTLALASPQRPGTIPPPPGANAQNPGTQEPAGGAGATQGDGVPLIQEVENSWLLTFDETEEAMTLEAFVKICQENTGINFTYSEETSQVLKSQKVRMFGPKLVAKTDFYSFFQIIMIINRFVCVQIGPDHLSVVVVASLDSPQRSSVRADAVYVTPEELGDYADQPATLVNTVLHLPNIDVRTMGNAMRAMVVDPNTMQLVPIPESNSLILTGFGNTIASLAKMLKLIDEVSAPEDPILPEFEVIPLEYTSADELADTLEELLEASRRATNTAQPRQGAQGPTGALQQGSVETKIMVQPRTNSLLVMAMPEDMPRIKELVARLDVDVIERERNYHFLSLENADAETMADVLEDFLQDASRIEQGVTGGQGRGQGAPTSSNSEIVVVPDRATNALLIAASRSRYQEVLDLIELLDRRQDQVLIETALIELSGTDALNLGVELGGATIPGADEYGGFGLSDFGLSNFTDNDGDGVPDVKVPVISTGLTAGILDGNDFNLPVLIAALEQKTNSNVLNIPSVLVNNNGFAIVNTVREEPTTTITTNGQGQTQENFNGYEEAGITLEISPTISASNYLRLNIKLEVSNFEGTFTGVIPPPRVTRTLETVVNVPDGDTMVVGGIVIDNTTETKDQVPFLGDIPIIGILFRYSEDSQQRLTLYFFITPHIMHDREFADLAAISYQKKLEAADTIGASRVQQVDPSFGKGKDAVDLQGFDLPVYQRPSTGEVDPNTLGIDSEKVNKMVEDSKKDTEEAD